jgi:hypothetical protein
MFLFSPKIDIRFFLQDPPMLTSTSNHRLKSSSDSLLMTFLRNPTLTSWSLNKQRNLLPARTERILGHTFGPQESHVLACNSRLHCNVFLVDPSYNLVYKATLPISLTLLHFC